MLGLRHATPDVCVAGWNPIKARRNDPGAAAEATPDSTSAVLWHSQAQITLSARHIELIRSRTSSSLPAAINWRSRRYCWRASHSLRLGRVVPVLPVGLARPLQSLWRARPRARAAV